jgi:hypothetical protein
MKPFNPQTLPGRNHSGPGNIWINPFDRNNFISGRQIYYGLYKRFPSVLAAQKLKTESVFQWLEKRADAENRGIIRYDAHDAETGQTSPESMIYIEYDRELIIHVDYTEGRVIYSNDMAYAKELFNEMAQFAQKPKKLPGAIYIVVESGAGIELQPTPCPTRKLTLKTHYNDDLVSLHPQLLRSLRGKGRSGLYLFHGRPGTGKSSYIRSLLPLLNKRCIFLSPRLAGNLDSPGLAGILLRNPESILIIEDAEDLLISRDQQPNAAISTLLNVTDGVLGASLGIQVICTFNTPLTRIDPALLRKGRLIERYEFGALSAEKARNLLQPESAVPGGLRPMTLAEIFNRPLRADTEHPVPSSIGFRQGNQPA